MWFYKKKEGGFFVKLKALLLVLFVTCVIATTCFAEKAPINQNAVSLPQERMALGGIHVGDTTDTVKSILGEPDSQEYGYSQMTEKKYAVWTYGNAATINYFENNGEYFVQIVKVDADNGFATPDGIKVGMSEKALKQVYGEPYFYISSHEGTGQYRYRNDRYSQVEFVFQVMNGKITNIGLGFND